MKLSMDRVPRSPFRTSTWSHFNAFSFLLTQHTPFSSIFTSVSPRHNDHVFLFIFFSHAMLGRCPTKRNKW